MSSVFFFLFVSAQRLIDSKMSLLQGCKEMEYLKIRAAKPKSLAGVPKCKLILKFLASVYCWQVRRFWWFVLVFHSWVFSHHLTKSVSDSEGSVQKADAVAAESEVVKFYYWKNREVVELQRYHQRRVWWTDSLVWEITRNTKIPAHVVQAVGWQETGTGHLEVGLHTSREVDPWGDNGWSMCMCRAGILVKFLEKNYHSEEKFSRVTCFLCFLFLSYFYES